MGNPAPLLLLDVDGVLNILGEDDTTDWDVTCTGWAVAEGSRFRITWAPDVVAALLRWIADGVEVQWLTTWGHDANRSLRDLLGLPELPVAGTYDEDDAGAPEAAGASHASVAPAAPDPLTGRWWKYDVVRRKLAEHPDRTIIWVDDELHRDSPFRRWAEEHPRVHAVGPDGLRGLTWPDLERLASLIQS